MAKPAHATSSTQRAAETMLDRETDARFWAQTGYKPGQKLDMRDPTDRAMSKVWIDVYNKVKDEDRRGVLVITYNHPVVESSIAAAQAQTARAAEHLETAAHPSMPPEDAHARVEAAQDAHAHAQAAIATAAAQQPVTVSPAVADAAAHDASVARGVPPPQAATVVIHPRHPARSGPNAHPSHPTLVIKNASPAHAVPVDSAEGHLALAAAQRAPALAVAAHHTAATVPAPPRGTTPPALQAHVRELAASRAHGAGARFVGTMLGAGDVWEVKAFPDFDTAQLWFSEVSDHPDAFRYLATWDTQDVPDEPINVMWGDSTTLMVDVAPPRERVQVIERTRDVPAPATPMQATGGNKEALFAVGGAGLLGIMLALSKHKRAH